MAKELFARYMKTNYWVGTLGSVVGPSGKKLKPSINRGYFRLSICHHGKIRSRLLHRMVWIAHKGWIPRSVELNHIDGVKLNPKLSNLEITSRSSNELHAYDLGLAKSCHAHYKASLSDKKAKRAVNLIVAGLRTNSDIGNQLGVSATVISMIRGGHNWRRLVIAMGYDPDTLPKTGQAGKLNHNWKHRRRASD